MNDDVGTMTKPKEAGDGAPRLTLRQKAWATIKAAVEALLHWGG